MTKETLLGIAIRAGYRHNVYAWHGYGVVAPTLVTTNGAASMVTRACESYEPVIHADPDPATDLTAHLVDAYRNALAAG